MRASKDGSEGENSNKDTSICNSSFLLPTRELYQSTERKEKQSCVLWMMERLPWCNFSNHFPHSWALCAVWTALPSRSHTQEHECVCVCVCLDSSVHFFSNFWTICFSTQSLAADKKAKIEKSTTANEIWATVCLFSCSSVLVRSCWWVYTEVFFNGQLCNANLGTKISCLDWAQFSVQMKEITTFVTPGLLLYLVVMSVSRDNTVLSSFVAEKEHSRLHVSN